MSMKYNMALNLVIIVSSLIINSIQCYYLEAESNFYKPKLERKNIVNKGVWTKSKLDGTFIDKTSFGNFIFRPNSIDVDNVVQNNYDLFDQNTIQDAPFVSAYIQRNKRSPDHIRKRRPRKNMKAGKIIKSSVEDAVIINSKVVSELKPSSIFNEHPYEIAILINEKTDRPVDKTMNGQNADQRFTNAISSKTRIADNIGAYVKNGKDKTMIPNSTVTAPKRGTKNNYYHENTHNLNILHVSNNDYNDSNAIHNRVNSKEKIEKNPTLSVSYNTFNKTIPKEPEIIKTVTERSLIKILKILTKTFKKIMIQHLEIKDIYDKLLDLSNDVKFKIANATTNFVDFNSKYLDIVHINKKFKVFEKELKAQQDYVDMKQKEIYGSIADFQEQRKIFLSQQKQFYAIQKLMLAQNEKINEKQDLITQAQNHISMRQHSCAKILKKVKEFINEGKYRINVSTVNQSELIDNTEIKADLSISPTSTTVAPKAETIKFSLFSIPIKNKLKSQDHQIIKEKDEKQIDDLVYKFYFNNTFIDNLIKSKILNSIATNSHSVDIVNRSKMTNKRNNLETTLMMPVNNTHNTLSHTPNKRERRWINHFSKHKYRRVHKLTENDTTAVNNTNDVSEAQKDTTLTNIRQRKGGNNDPFSTMAKNFCNEIAQHENEQSLKWCVEKALRRLKSMKNNAFSSVSKLVKKQDNQAKSKSEFISKISPKIELFTSSSFSTVTPRMEDKISPTEPVSRVTPRFVKSRPTSEVFFPDNDELESNLKEYDLIPDTEGNVYYDGSVHLSDYGLVENDGATSDIMPGLMESNSRIEIDPMTFDIQAKRRAFVRRYNENLMKHMRRV